MGKASEAPDNVAVTFGMGKIRFAQRPKQRHRAILVRQIFGVTERQVDEGPQLRGDPLIMPG